MSYKMNMMVMNTGVRMSKANVLSGLEDMHQQSVECITQFTDIKGTSQKAYSFFEESLESMRALERCIDEARELIDVLDYCMKETATAEKDVEKYIGLSATSGNSESGNIPDALPSQNTDGNILPQYTANLPEGTGTTGKEIYKGSYTQMDNRNSSVCIFNAGNWVSCTFTTLYRLHQKGLGYPFDPEQSKLGYTSGCQWFDNYAGVPENRYATIAEKDGIPGKNGLQILFDEYMASEQEAPLENIVLSFGGDGNNHVMLIDSITKDGTVTFKDNGYWYEKGEERLYAEGTPCFETAAAAVDNAEYKQMSFQDFLNKYQYMHMHGAILIGTPQ